MDDLLTPAGDPTMTTATLIGEIATTLLFGWIGWQLAELGGLVVKSWMRK